MASANPGVPPVAAGKDVPLGAAIEATDLASLLCQFEEATSSSDDLSIPSRAPKNLKNILLKAKSVGSSPAPTPPASPPHSDGRTANHDPGTSTQVPGAKSLPVQLKFFINQNGTKSQIITNSSGSKVSSLPIQITSSSGIHISKSHTSFSQPSSKSSAKLTFLPQHGTSSFSGTRMVSNNTSKPTANLTAASSSKPVVPMPLPLRPASSPLGKPSSGVEKPSLSLFTPPMGDFASQQQSVQAASPTVMSVKSPTIIGVKKKNMKPTTISLDTYMKRKSLTPNPKITSPKVASTAKPQNKSPSPLKFKTAPTVRPTPSLLQAKLETNQLAEASISLLQSMLQSKTPNRINSKVSSTQLCENLSKKDTVVKNVRKNNKIKPAPATAASAAVSNQRNPQSLQNVVSHQVSSQDHDYCFLKMSTKDIIQQTVRTVKEEDSITDLKIEPLKDSSEYEFTKIEPHEFINFGVAEEKPSDLPPPDLVEVKGENVIEPEVLEQHDISPMEELGSNADKVPEEENVRKNDMVTEEISTPRNEITHESINAFVFEEGEFLVDDQGNDILENEQCDTAKKPEGGAANPVHFKSDVSVRGRKYRKYNRQADTSSSPVAEDSANFFDKIPSHYTVLSIPAKPTKTTVFASTNRAIGSTDHLELEDRSEEVDSGHFDKVPAHRRCFTNTTKEVDVPQASTPNGVANDAPATSSTSLSNKHSRVTSSRQSSSERTEVRRSSRSRSPSVPRRSPSVPRRSPSVPRRSRSVTRRDRTVSMGSGRSLSSCSTCSSSSYCSTCSGRSWSESRSRSRSWSGDRKSRSRSCDRRSRSRSRSHSAGRRRDREMRSKRSRRESYSDSREHGYWNSRNKRSRSRSRSPTHRSRQRSHHHSGIKSRLAAGGQISQKRREREEEKVKAMEERRVVYVGKIPEGYTKRQLYKRFERFGDIKEVKVNFREHGDNYGFVTFSYACDAIAAKERGNNIPGERKFDLCFGGRRRFCPDQYADLDGNREIEEEYAPMSTEMTGELDYAALLRQHSTAQRKNR